MEMKKRIVVICSQLGGRSTRIGSELAKKLKFTLINTERLVKDLAIEEQTSFRELSESFVSGEIDFDMMIDNMLSRYVGKEDVVVEGRSATFLLSREADLKVLLVSERDDRVERVMERRGWSKEAAEAEIDRSDEERRELGQKLVGKSWLDPRLYHITLNISLLSDKQVVETIESRLR